MVSSVNKVRSERLESLTPDPQGREGGEEAPPAPGRVRQQVKKKRRLLPRNNRNPNLYKCCFDIYKKTSCSVRRTERK